jgi:diguanylate cyclase (GGDEF)-like protein
MNNATNPTPRVDLRNRKLAIGQSAIVVCAFAALAITQSLGFFLLGNGRASQSVSECVLVAESLVALACAWVAIRRSRGITGLFWFLFAIVVTILLLPTAIQAHDTIFGTLTISESTRGLIYCLYGAPILMMLFLPETHGRERVRSEIFLDLFQVAVTVGLIYSTFFFIPDRHMVPSDAFLHSVTVSDIQSILLVIASMVRLQFARVPETRNLFLRLTIFLASCAVTTFVGDWVGVHHPGWLTLFDVAWGIPILVAALTASTWAPSAEPPSPPAPASFVSFLGANLVLVTMLSSTAVLVDYWKQAYGETLTNISIVVSLLALTLRLALTQFHQYQEIASRRTAQEQLALSHQKVAGLLKNAQQQTAEITQINQLGNLLQACTSRKEVFALIPERMSRLFPGSSGAISALNTTRDESEIVAHWGDFPPLEDALSWNPFPAAVKSITAPLVANDEVLGVLAVTAESAGSKRSPLESNDFERRLQIASALAEQIALTTSNLDLREALHNQAIRDPLTGLFNRRYMREFLEREIHRANRHRHPLSLMMLDIDHFKRYNDSFGHAAGDDVLRFVGKCLNNSIRADDLACRYGGEEFIVILPDCSLAQAIIRAQQICDRVRTLYSEHPSELPQAVTVSIGVASFKETTDEIDLLLRFADEALYLAKHEGRDRVIVARPEPSATVVPIRPETRSLQPPR